MKILFEGEQFEFEALFKAPLPAPDPRIKLVLEAINQVDMGTKIYEATILDDILTLRRNILAEKESRVKYQDLAYEAMNFIDRMLGGKTNVEDFKDRLKQVHAIYMTLTDEHGETAAPDL